MDDPKYVEDLSPEDQEKFYKYIDRIVAYNEAKPPIWIKTQLGYSQEEHFIPLFNGQIERVQAHPTKKDIYVKVRTGDESDRDGVESYSVPPRDFRYVYEYLKEHSVNHYYKLKVERDEAIATLEARGWDNLDEMGNRLGL